MSHSQDSSPRMEKQVRMLFFDSHTRDFSLRTMRAARCCYSLGMKPCVQSTHNYYLYMYISLCGTDAKQNATRN
jgi:hypothetical protein